MGWASICFGLATAAALGFAARGRRTAPDALCLAVVFAAWFVIWEALRPFVSRDDLGSLDPALDALLGSLCTLSWLKHRRRWRAALVITFTIQSALHVIFRYPGAVEAGGTYKLLVNLTHAAQLALVAWEGGQRVGLDLIDWLFPVPDMRHRSFSARLAQRFREGQGWR